jgi:hypothetical protein
MVLMQDSHDCPITAPGGLFLNRYKHAEQFPWGIILYDRDLDFLWDCRLQGETHDWLVLNRITCLALCEPGRERGMFVGFRTSNEFCRFEDFLDNQRLARRMRGD